MRVFVVSGRAGGDPWPVRVFREEDEMPAGMFIEILTGIAQACRSNLKEFRDSELYSKMNLAERAACENIITAPLDAMDASAAGTNLSQPVFYTKQLVALHD